MMEPRTSTRSQAHVRAQGNCRPPADSSVDLVCVYDTTIGPDSAHVTVEAGRELITVKMSRR
jgi:hypothetical protein